MTDTDRELLAWAAKAAGWTWWRSKHGYWNLTSPEGDEHTACHNWSAYDPCTGAKLTEPTAADALREIGFDPENDSGQAFELMVKLYLSEAVELAHHELSDTRDIYAATRRSIVRAAAEIGRNME